MKSTYLHGLNSLRFIAAFLVVIFHCNDALRQIDKSLFSSKIFLSKGHFAVDYFFVLSGFLLTYLSLYELDKFDKINFKRFFMRRILRIFPLYYLAAILGFLLIGVLYPIVYKDTFLSFSISEGVFYYLFFLPNYVIVKWQNIGPMYSLWSIGVEEQFYLLFPFIILGFKKMKLKVYYFLVLTISYTCFYLSVDFSLIQLPLLYKLFIVKTLKFHFLLFGCFIGAGYFFNKKAWYFEIFNQIYIKAFVLLLFFISICVLPKGMDQYNFLGALVFTLLMLSFIHYDPKFNIDFKILTYLGTISYGIYIFHPFVSIGVRFVMTKFEKLHFIVFSAPILFYALVLLFSIAISHYSYRYYESYFLKLKSKYSSN